MIPPCSGQTNDHQQGIFEGKKEDDVRDGSILKPQDLHTIEEEKLVRMISSDVLLARMAGPEGHRARLRLQQVTRLKRSSGSSDAAKVSAAVPHAEGNSDTGEMLECQIDAHNKDTHMNI